MICILITVIRIEDALKSEEKEVIEYLEDRYIACKYKNYPKASKVLSAYVSNLYIS